MPLDRIDASKGLERGLLRGWSPVVLMVAQAQHLRCPVLRRLARTGVVGGPGATPACDAKIRHQPLPLLLTVAVGGSPQAHTE